MNFSRKLDIAIRYLSQADQVMAMLIKRSPRCTIKPHKNYYWELIDAIISQQLSVKAAASIEKRFQTLFGSAVPSPEAILAKTADDLRGVGLSMAKANYIRDLAQHILNGAVIFNRFDDQTNEEITRELTAIKGIGEWTAQMFLIFCMGRLDVLPTGDLGIRKGVQVNYRLAQLASPQTVREVAEVHKWHPYESVASWYIWHSLDNVPGL